MLPLKAIALNLVSLFGRWNWWFPEPARRALGLRAHVEAQMGAPS